MAPRKAVVKEEEEEIPDNVTPIDHSRKYTLQKQFLQIVQGGNKHPTWKAVLDALHQLGLHSIETDVVQFPSAENGNVACVKARITLEDGTFFEALGYASEANIPNKMIAKHLVHMAETRAKGRAGRDAINVGEALLEELGEDGSVSKGPFTPVVSNPVHDTIDELWASNDNERKAKVRGYIMDHLPPDRPADSVKTLTDVKSLPNDLLKKALAESVKTLTDAKPMSNERTSAEGEEQ